MLHGRGHERAVIGRLLAAARAGEVASWWYAASGIGKSALLADAAQRAVGMRVLRAVGVEAESAALPPPCASCCILCSVGWSGCEPQARALRVALGIQAGRRPTGSWCRWPPSRCCPTAPGVPPAVPGRRRAPGGPAVAGGARLRARRLAAEPVALLLAVRDGTGEEVGTAGLAELPLTRLAPDAAAALLDEHHGAHLDPVVRRQLGGKRRQPAGAGRASRRAHRRAARRP